MCLLPLHIVKSHLGSSLYGHIVPRTLPTLNQRGGRKCKLRCTHASRHRSCAYHCHCNNTVQAMFTPLWVCCQISRENQLLGVLLYSATHRLFPIVLEV